MLDPEKEVQEQEKVVQQEKERGKEKTSDFKEGNLQAICVLGSLLLRIDRIIHINDLCCLFYRIYFPKKKDTNSFH